MEEKETIKKSKTISEKMCGMRDCEHCGPRHHHHYVFRVLLTLFVVITAFWCGLKIGELKGFIIANQITARPVQFRMMSDEAPEFQSRKMIRPTGEQTEAPKEPMQTTQE